MQATDTFVAPLDSMLHVVAARPVDFLSAVETCSSMGSELGKEFVLMPYTALVTAFGRLTVLNQTFVNDVFTAITRAVALAPRNQLKFDMWSWDAYRACRGQSYVLQAARSENTFISDTRPCSWKLSFACCEKRALLSQGFQAAELSDAWLQRVHALQPSPYAQLAGSGITLVQSALVVGAATTPTGGTWLDGRPFFWELGPIVSLLWRVSKVEGILQGLLPVRAAAADVAWQLLRNSTAVHDQREVMGDPRTADGSVWQGYNVGNWPDYVIQVQGCMRATGIERLLLVTRTGMRLQAGRLDCSSRFVEDAPPGGYLAAIEAYHSTGSVDAPGARGFRLHQMRFVWAGPDPAAAPTYKAEVLPLADASVCAAAKPTAEADPVAYAAAMIGGVNTTAASAAAGTSRECGPLSNVVCPSNLCCGDAAVTDRAINACGRGLGPCKISCINGFGLCGSIPEQDSLLFATRPSPADAAGGPALSNSGRVLYSLYGQTLLPYKDAVAYCANLTLLGRKWELVTGEDVLRFGMSEELRFRAFSELLEKQVWITVDPMLASAAPSLGCMRAGLLSANGEPSPVNTMTPSNCGRNAGVLCRAPAAEPGPSVTALAGADVRFVAGLHELFVSRAVGSGPSGANCAFTSLPYGEPSALQLAEASPSPALNASISIPLTGLRVRMAASPSTQWGDGNTEALAGIQLSTAALRGDEQNATSSWHDLPLQDGEVVVAVSGCAGGYVELITFHTNEGRLLGAPLGRMSQCSTPFQLAAPPGANLVGLMGIRARYIEQLALVWGRPLGAPAAPAQSSGSSGGSGLTAGAVIGIAAGVGVAVLNLCILAALLILRRCGGGQRASDKAKHGPHAAAAPSPGGVDGDFKKPLSRVGTVTLSLAAGLPAELALALQQQPKPGDPNAYKVPSDSALDMDAVRTTAAAMAAAAPELGRGSGASPSRPRSSSPSVVPPGAFNGSASPPAGVRSGRQSLDSGNVRVHPTLHGLMPEQPQRCFRLSYSPLARSLAGSAPADRVLSSHIEHPDAAAATAAAAEIEAAVPAAHAPLASGQHAGLVSSNSIQLCVSSVSTPLVQTASVVPSNMVVLPPPAAGGEEEDLLSDPLLNMRLGREVEVEQNSYLGHGASGVVRRGVLRMPGSAPVPVAVKLLSVPDRVEEEAGVHLMSSSAPGAAEAAGPATGALRTLASEVRVLARLAHPNIVSFVGASLEPACPFVVMELCACSLNKLVHGKDRTTGRFTVGFDLVTVLHIARDIAAGLAYLHPTVVHRDLKPGNVLLDDTGTAKISDFGLARFKQHTALTTRDVEVGTAPYMAPELFMPGDAKVSDRADVYSYGVILNELITRKKPWEGMRGVIVAFQVAMERKRPPLPPADHPLCPAALKSLIQRCMRHSPDERPSSSEIEKRLTVMLAKLGHVPGGQSSSGEAARPVDLAGKSRQHLAQRIGSAVSPSAAQGPIRPSSSTSAGPWSRPGVSAERFSDEAAGALAAQDAGMGGA